MSVRIELDRAVIRSLGPSRAQAFAVRLPDASISVQTHELLAGDAERLYRAYRFLAQLHAHARAQRDQPDGIARLVAHLESMDLPRFQDDVAALGYGLGQHDAPPRLHKAYHDLRGGSLLALLMHVDLVQQGRGEPEDVQRIALLARDHLKIIRNAVPDLDPVAYDADLRSKAHPMALLREKWGAVRYRLARREVTVELDCPYDGTIAARCLEFSTLDRIVYNLVNNAAEHTHDGLVRLVVMPVHEPHESHAEGMLLRLAVINRLDPHQRDTLRHRFGGEPSELFLGGFTTAGHGLGLRICADLVAHAAGLPSIALALDHGHLGVRIVDDWFVAWFVWPSSSPLRLAA